MSQQEVYNIIRDNPRICTKEISERLGLRMPTVSWLLRKMIDKEIKIIEPNKQEKEKLLKQYPTMKYAGKEGTATNKIKLFVVIE